MPEPARAAIERNELLVSPMVLLELQYLYEVKRTTQPARAVLGALREEIGIRVCDAPWANVVALATGLAWTRDPFDRLIVAHAMLREAALVTKDRQIHTRYKRAIWS
ncbi:MAG: PIN domain-containing protein [bacterium]|nr:PIN domain-containing protein [bacterium]